MNTKESFETFVNNFSEFWKIAAKAQAHYQLFGSLEAQISESSGETKTKLQAYRDEILSLHDTEVADVFSALIKLSGSGDEYSTECAEMLSEANMVTCSNFAKLIAGNDKLTKMFIGDQLRK